MMEGLSSYEIKYIYIFTRYWYSHVTRMSYINSLHPFHLKDLWGFHSFILGESPMAYLRIILPQIVQEPLELLESKRVYAQSDWFSGGTSIQPSMLWWFGSIYFLACLAPLMLLSSFSGSHYSRSNIWCVSVSCCSEAAICWLLQIVT